RRSPSTYTLSLHTLFRSLVVAIDVALPELALRAEGAGAEQLDQAVQLQQVVLHRRRGQEQLEAAVERAQETVRRPCLRPGELVGLVDDDEVPVAGGELVDVLARQVVADDEAVACEGRVPRHDDVEVLVELVPQLLAP